MSARDRAERVSTLTEERDLALALLAHRDAAVNEMRVERDEARAELSAALRLLALLDAAMNEMREERDEARAELRAALESFRSYLAEKGCECVDDGGNSVPCLACQVQRAIESQP